MTIEEILAGESKNVEFKVQRPRDSSKYMKTVVAFSNGEGGRIVFGVDDASREVVGIPKEIVFSEIDAITAAISDNCEPLVIPDVYLQSIDDKTIIIAEISAGRQRPYYIKSMEIKEGTYIRVSGTSRPAGRDLTAEMYYEDEGRSYDKVIRRDLTVTDEEIADLCLEMKEVAIANAKSKTQAETIKDVTKNVLLSWGWGFWRKQRMAVFIRQTDIFFCLVKTSSFRKFSVECSRERRGLFLWTDVSTQVHYGDKSTMPSSLCCEIFIWVQDWKAFIGRTSMSCLRTVFENSLSMLL